MGKRSEFVRKPRDFYPTPIEAVEPLVEHLPKTFDFAEPCAGNGVLVNHIETLVDGAVCTWASDIEPQNKGVLKYDYSTLTSCELEESEFIITNPPWDRKILHPMINFFTKKKPTWLLFDADWIHTKQSTEYLPLLKKIVSIGRVQWIPDSKSTGKDNCCWYLFSKGDSQLIQFVGRKS